TVLTRYQAIAEATPGAVSTDIPSSQVDSFVDLALKVKSQKIESLDLTPPEITPSHPDFDVAREPGADKIDEAAQPSARATGAVSPAIPCSQVYPFVDLALKVKSQKIESLDLTPPELTPSHPDFDVARELVADKIEEASESSEQDKGAVSAPGGDLSAAAGVD